MSMRTEFFIVFLTYTFLSFILQAKIGLAEVSYPAKNDFQYAFNHLRSRTSVRIQTSAVEELIIRVLGKNAIKFKVFIDQNIGPEARDTFKIKKIDSGKVEINGTSGVAVAWGLYYYLKKFCYCHISWEGSQINLPKTLPDVDEIITSNDRYYQNVCTAGYSSTWWRWDQWEKNIDWMALNGINLALAFHAQEAIWEKVYLKLNLNKAEVDQHFGGPAFLPWSRMGNIRGWAGPLSQHWHNHTIKLQHSIVRRMRELGIIPVLPAFAGHVPRDLVRVFPNASVTKVEEWNDFPDEYCCPYMLDPTDPLFQTIGEKFLKLYISEFGTDNIYNCDSFNENNPHKADSNYIRETGKAIYSAMKNVDPDAIWLMQGWLFVHSSDFWTKEFVKAFLTSVPIGKMIILDLQSEQFPQYKRFQSYYGQPYIWCMLHNFGGTLGMFGSSEIINQRIFEARHANGSTMIGTGLSPEGINQNYVIYELMNEMAYRKRPVILHEWFSNYAIRRYGFAENPIQQAWKILGEEIYNHQDERKIRGQYIISKRPSLNLHAMYWYGLEEFYICWKTFSLSNVTKRNDLFKHDLVDISRQALQITADFIYNDIRDSFKRKNLTDLESLSSQFLNLFDDLDEILGSSNDFLLGKWLESAKSIAQPGNKLERENYEFNARNQITLWGPNGEIVDYANKQWSGVVQDYFKPRWSIFLNELQKSLKNHKKFNVQKVHEIIFNEVELPFSYSKKMYPTKARGDSIKIAAKLFKKWKKVWDAQPEEN